VLKAYMMGCAHNLQADDEVLSLYYSTHYQPLFQAPISDYKQLCYSLKADTLLSHRLHAIETNASQEIIAGLQTKVEQLEDSLVYQWEYECSHCMLEAFGTMGEGFQGYVCPRAELERERLMEKEAEIDRLNATISRQRKELGDADEKEAELQKLRKELAKVRGRDHEEEGED